jgi:hypothetical protein
MDAADTMVLAHNAPLDLGFLVIALTPLTPPSWTLNTQASVASMGRQQHHRQWSAQDRW